MTLLLESLVLLLLELLVDLGALGRLVAVVDGLRVDVSGLFEM